MNNYWLTKKSGGFLRKLIPTLLLGLIFSFVFVFGLLIFKKIFIDQNLDYINSAIGAFMGAFFAFLFIRISDGLTRIYERQIKHYNALVKLEHICNEYLNIVSDNIFVIDDFAEIAQKAMANSEPFIYFNVLHEFLVDKEITLNLTNLELINEVFSFEAGVDKINNSISATNRFYGDIKNTFLQKNIDFGTYKLNVEILIGKLKELKVFLLNLDKENKQIVAMTRILMRDKPFLTCLIHLISKKGFNDKMKEEIPKEIKELENEIETNRKKSKEKIDEMLKTSNRN